MTRTTTCLICLCFLLFAGCDRPVPDSILEEAFRNPPASAKPRTWFHAMSGNMTPEGLSKDLESIEKAGIGGILLFNVSQGIPNGPVKYNSNQHHEMINHAASECERLGLSFGVHNCDGWSSSGGPWITPDKSMKMVVWSEIITEGGNIEVRLPEPTTREGFYRDIAVIAYPSLASEILDIEDPPVVTASDRNFDISTATDNRIDDGALIQQYGSGNPWIQFDYGKPREIRSVFLVFNDRNGEATLQVSDDGKTFKSVRQLYKVRTGKGEWAINDQFEPVRSRYFRLLLNQTMTFKEVKLLSTYNMHNVLGRTSIARTEYKDLLPIGDPAPNMLIDKSKIRDISTDMDQAGLLRTELPGGTWTILRFGYTSTGAFNHPASDEGRGLECDKLNREAFKLHYDAFVSKVLRNTLPVAPNAMQYVEIDSYEMGGQNWTENMDKIFLDKKGYSLLEYLPLFTGKFVESALVSEAVLWDFRDLVCDLMTENYFGYFAELCRQDGIKSYIEPYGFGPLKELDVGSKADINMGEFWVNRPMEMLGSAVSSSHIYGKNIISAESFTTQPGINWKGHPGMAKIWGDKAWAQGINEFMFHRFAHQANTHVKPGMTMNRWGFHFDRTQTWWENAGPSWFTYIARGSYLLRQGVPVSDILVFVGDGAPNSAINRNDLDPAIPAGINFDCVNADVLINRLKVKNGTMVLPEGTAYRMLVLKNCETLSLSTLKRISEIADAGVPVVGLKPEKPAGHLVQKKDRTLFDELVYKTWSLPKTYTDFDWNSILKREGILPDLLIAGREDINFAHRRLEGADIYFIYNPDLEARQFECTFRIGRRIPELWNPMNGEIKKSGQFLNDGELTKTWINLKAEESMFVVFRESSKGVIAAAKPGNNYNEAYFLDENKTLVLETNREGHIEVELSNGKIITSEIQDIKEPKEISGPWEVEFLKEHDYEATQIFKELTDWKDHADDNIRYYSGTAIYRNQFDFTDPLPDKESQFILDLGVVNIVAEVFLNGKNVGVSWIPPHMLDISDALQSGENQLEIRITNQWSNKLIGDERFPLSFTGYKLEGNFPKGKMLDWYVKNEPMPEGKRTTFCTGQFYEANDELMPSGLIGQVQIITIKVKTLTDKF